ncbi:MAG: glycosyltransferase [Candidatus Marinimicrobia bacterium]|nr:glycosyltransferase [Candidatus Neomarinimicrobiota bacterium]MBT3632804.1 glycosyltransferase [Candidatus Neomarinimicrobiota bacterium]MBT3681914.1 glycosyltransferase [Candidatus Neomarinimicrobiota bacterium]MBT3759057.1 glycosyltransferase [Candidatus Neomarinimicrobiota bacterium]MBT3895044.1 glycosyltransferase [Candidatus Neomarinimicrobiota bacterium]
MKILYIAPENVVGNLNTWKAIHESRGNECRFITFFPSQFGFPDDICLNLPFVAPAPIFIWMRKLIYSMFGGPDQQIELDGYPPVWKPANPLIKSFFSVRDQLWRKTIEPIIEKYDFLEYDVLHLETGLGLYRDGNFVKRFKEKNGTVINTFHGVELRHRGVIPAIDKMTDLNLTSELDLLPKHPNLKYLHLVFDIDQYQPDYSIRQPITMCHATRNRYFKGSDKIIEVCRKLESSHNIRFLLAENVQHSKALEMKQEANIYIDQIANIAPGYGMNSIEAMAMGSTCLTLMDKDYEKFMPDHPFVNVNPENLKVKLIQLIENPEKITEIAQNSHEWLKRTHSIQAVGDQLYNYYQKLGLNGV